MLEEKIINAYKGMAYGRCDDNGTAFYFSVDDFDGLKREEYAFSSSLGHSLQGYIYSYDGYIQNRLVVFDHGMGGGHTAYMKEIERLCRHGFRVLAYDHTGCMESGGASTNGMAQSLRDLNDCLNAINSDVAFDGIDISVMGHSWGGFSSLNICKLHPEISHVVVLSGFVSVEELINSYFGGIMKSYRKPILELEKNANPDFVSYNAVESIKGSDAKFLLIYSANDKLCSKKHFDILKKGLADRPNVNFILEKNKGHNPNYTEDAVTYLGSYVKSKTKLMKKNALATFEQKKNFLSSFDWNRMTAQDEKVWNEIINFFNDFE